MAPREREREQNVLTNTYQIFQDLQGYLSPLSLFSKSTSVKRALIAEHGLSFRIKRMKAVRGINSPVN